MLAVKAISALTWSKSVESMLARSALSSGGTKELVFPVLAEELLRPSPQAERSSARPVG